MINLNELTVERFAKVFDMAILAPDTREEAIRTGCRQARAYNLAAFYTTPCWTKVVAEELAGSDVLVGVGIGFPYGTPTTAIKMASSTTDSVTSTVNNAAFTSALRSPTCSPELSQSSW